MWTDQTYSYKLERIVDPAAQPLTLAEVKTHLKKSGTDEDTYLTTLIEVATQQAEEFTNRSFITQTWALYLDDWLEGDILLPRGKTQSVTSIQYYDSNGTLQTVDTANYRTSLGYDIGRIRPVDAWPLANTDFPFSVVITYVTGYGDSHTDVPEGLKQGIRVMVADLDNFRQSYTKQAYSVLPNGKPYYEMLLDPYKIYF